MELYKRKSELIVNGQVYDSDNYDIDFKIPFSNNSEPDISEISIYNMSEKTLGEFTKGQGVVLNAGYGKDTGVIFEGDIDSIEIIRQGVDKELRLFGSSGHTQVKETDVKVSYSKGKTNIQILKDLIKGFELEVGKIEVGKTITYSTARSFSGLLIDIVLGIVKESHAKFYIQNNKIFIIPLGKGIKTGFILNADTGLIGSPEIIDIETEFTVKGEKFEEKKGAKTEKKESVKKRGWKVQALLNHRIGIDSIIQIQSRNVNGTFRVVSGEHSDFITTLEVLEQ